MDIKEAKEFLEDKQIDNVRLVTTDMLGIPRGKRVPVDKFLKGCERGITFTLAQYCLTVDLPLTNMPNLGPDSGYPDGAMWPDLGTLTVLPWDEGSAWVICDMRLQDGGEVIYDPRTILKKQIAKLDQSNMKALVGMEYECYILKETPRSLREKKWAVDEFEPLFIGTACYDQVRLGEAGTLMKEIARLLEQAGVSIDSSHIEMGGGHMEFPIKEADPLTAGDRAVLYKTAMKEICSQHALMASFMAKIDDSWEGLSGAVHHSLVDQKGTNLFHDPTRPFALSETFDHWCEGLLQNLVDMTLILLPYYNSYKRPLPGCYVANTTTWGIESRAAALRAINFDPKATRIESRLPAADANPYLAIAAHLAAGNYGLRHELHLRPPFVGSDPAIDDQGRADVECIPASLEAAIARFKASAQMREFFGSEFCNVLLVHRENELDFFSRKVSDLERARYMEFA